MDKITWKSEKRKTSELKSFEGNPRQASEKEIKDLDKSLERFNLASPLVINTDGTVIGGNFRLSREKERGTKYWMIGDHVTAVAGSEANTGQNIIFGTKPIQILVPYVKILSPRDGIVMEPFCGSGSTIIASEIMKRKCRAIELSPLYGEVIIRRFEKFTGKKAVKLTN